MAEGLTSATNVLYNRCNHASEELRNVRAIFDHSSIRPSFCRQVTTETKATQTEPDELFDLLFQLKDIGLSNKQILGSLENLQKNSSLIERDEEDSYVIVPDIVSPNDVHLEFIETNSDEADKDDIYAESSVNEIYYDTPSFEFSPAATLETTDQDHIYSEISYNEEKDDESLDAPHPGATLEEVTDTNCRDGVKALLERGTYFMVTSVFKFIGRIMDWRR